MATTSLQDLQRQLNKSPIPGVVDGRQQPTSQSADSSVTPAAPTPAPTTPSGTLPSSGTTGGLLNKGGSLVGWVNGRRQTVGPGAPTVTTTPTPGGSGSVPTYTPAQATAGQTQAQGYEAHDFPVTPDMTVEGRLAGILSQDSSLMQQARARAEQTMQRRGLLNSTMALSAAEQGVIAQALPIAQQDASTYAQAMLATNQAINQAREFSAGQLNQAAMLNAQLRTDVDVSNASAFNAAMSQAADNIVRDRLAKIQADTTLTTTQMQTQMQHTIAQLDAANRERIANIQADTSLSIAEKDNITKQIIAQQDQATRQAIATLQANTSLTMNERDNASREMIAQGDNATKELLVQMQEAGALARNELTTDTQLQIAHLDNDTKDRLGLLDAQNRQLVQTNAVAANMYVETVKNIAAIATDDKMSQAAKDDATQSQLNLLNQGLQAAGEVARTDQAAVSSLDLSQYFVPVEAGSTVPSF